MINYKSARSQGLIVVIKTDKHDQEHIVISYCKPGRFVFKEVAQYVGCDRETLTNRFISEFQG